MILRLTFSEYGHLGPEWSIIIQGFWGSIFIGGAIGFFVGGQHAAVKFTDRNEATKFLNELDAKVSIAVHIELLTQLQE